MYVYTVVSIPYPVRQCCNCPPAWVLFNKDITFFCMGKMNVYLTTVWIVVKIQIYFGYSLQLRPLSYDPNVWSFCLTPNMWAIRPSLTQSKWNMEEICGLKLHFSYLDMPQDFFWELPPCANHVIFITEFVLLTKTPPFYEGNSFNRKRLAHGGIFSRPLFTIIFRPKILKFHPYSILTG